jgi:hypothetical protein
MSSGSFTTLSSGGGIAGGTKRRHLADGDPYQDSPGTEELLPARSGSAATPLTQGSN